MRVRPLSTTFRNVVFSLTSSLIFLTPLSPVHSATVMWDAGGADAFWSNASNWSGDALPQAGDDLVFGSPAPALILLNGNRALAFNTVTFNNPGNYTLGAFGTSNQLSLAATNPNFVISSGTKVSLNALLAAGTTLNLNGGGTLELTHFYNQNGNIVVDGAGTTLRIVSRAPYSLGFGGTATIRQEIPQLGQTYPSGTAETITLTNGGAIAFVGGGINPDSTTKNYVLGTGGGTFNIGGGQQFNLDDAGQISGTGLLTKTGNGRLTFATSAYGLAGGSLVEGGFLEFRINNTGGSTFATTASHTVTGGVMTIASAESDGTSRFRYVNLTLNGGSIGLTGANRNYGDDAVTASTMTLTSGNILVADVSDARSARNLFINSALQGSGTIQILGGGNGSGRVITQGFSAASTTFDGRLVLNDNAALESNPRNSSSTGRTFGSSSAVIELKGFNAILDMRDSGGASATTGQTFSYGNNVEVTGTQKGGVQTIALNLSTTTGSTNNIFDMGTLTLGTNQLNLSTSITDYRMSFDTLALTGSGVINTGTNTGASGILTFTAAVAESGSARTLTKIGANSSSTNTAQMNFDHNMGLSILNIVQGNVNFRGSDGKTVLGAVSGASTLNVSTQGVLILDDRSGVLASGQRLNAATVVNMNGGMIQLQSLASAATTASQIIENLNLSNGRVTLDAVANNVGALSVLRLGATTTLTRGTATSVNFSGTSLGLAGNTGRILINGQADTGFLGGWATVGNEFAKYSTTVSDGYALGVTALVAADYTLNPVESDYTTGLNVKSTTGGTITLGADRAINSLNIQNAAGTTLATNGNTLTIESGGLLISGNPTSPALHTITGTAAGGLTAGTTANAAQLFITQNSTTTVDISARITNNLAGGAVSLVKAGTGVLRLANTTVSGTFTGDIVVTEGRLDVFTPGSINASAAKDIILAGGALELLANNVATNTTINYLTDVIVRAHNSTLGTDNNNLTTGSNTDQNFIMGSLIFEAPYSGGATTLSYGGWDSTDIVFNGVTLANTPTLFALDRSDRNAAFTWSGLVQGSGGFIMTGGTDESVFEMGGGTSDTTNNTYTGDIIIRGGQLVGNKGTNTVAFNGDIIIDGGVFSFKNSATQQNPIASTSVVYLLSGTLGVDESVNAASIPREFIGVVPELVMKGGTLNSGWGTFTINKATITGGAAINVAGNSHTAGTLVLNDTEMLRGAPGIALQGDSVSDVHVLRLTGSYFKSTGVNITLNSSASTFSDGSRVELQTDMQILTDGLMANSWSTGISVTGTRELLLNELDFGAAVRSITIAPDAYYMIHTSLVNGGLTKAGTGTLVLSAFLAPSTFDGVVNVNAGVLNIRNHSSLGSTVGSTLVASGATLELEAGITVAENLTLSGNGAVDTLGALVSRIGGNRLTGGITLSGGAVISTFAAVQPASSFGTNNVVNINYSALHLEGAIGGTGTLTLRGEGYGFASGAMSQTGGLIKDGAGIWTLSGTSSYAGLTDIAAGVLVAASDTALGSTAAGTRIQGGASLVLSNANIGSESLELHGAGHPSQRGILTATGGASTISGTITLVTDVQNTTATLDVQSGSTLNVLGSITSSTSGNLVLGGAGDGSLGGSAVLAIGSGTLTKTGTGTWMLGGGASTFTGATALAGGTLVLDTTSSKLSDSAALNFAGGNLTLVGSGNEVVNGLNLVAGGAELNLGGATLTVGTLARSAGATINFGTNGIFSSSAADTAGILGAYATKNGTDWATSTGAAFTGYVVLSEENSGPVIATNNALITRTQQNLGAAITANTLKLGGSVLGVGFGSGVTTLTTGGVLYDGSTGSTAGLMGTGNFTAGGAELIFHVDGGTLDSGLVLVGSNGLTKDGSGTLILSGASTFTGDIWVNEGFIAIQGPGGTTDPTLLGLAGSRVITLNGGGFSVISGSFDPNASTKSFVIGPDGGTLHVGSSDLLAASGSREGGLLSLNDTNQLSGSGTLTKTGSGQLLLGGTALNFSGDIIVQGGLLRIDSLAGMGGARPEMTITVGSGARLATNIEGIYASIVLLDGSTLQGIGDNTTRIFYGNVSISGNVRMEGVSALDNGVTPNLAFSGRITQAAGSVLDIYGTRNDRGVTFDSANDLRGTIRLNTNAALQVIGGGSLGDAVNRATVELKGVNSRLLMRANSTTDFNANLTATANSTLEFGNNGTSAGNHFLSLNNLTVADGVVFTTVSNNSFQGRFQGSTILNGSNTFLNYGANMVHEGAVSGSAALHKLGAGTLFLRGVDSRTADTVIQQGIIRLMDGGQYTGGGNFIIKGGRIELDNTGSALNRITDTSNFTLYGGGIFNSGNETLGGLTVHGSVDIRQALTANVAQGLTFSGTIATARQLGGVIDFRTESVSTLGSTGANSRIIFTGQSTIGFLGGGIVVGNDWAQYSTALDGGLQRGVFAMGSYSTNTAEGSWTGLIHLNINNNSPVLTTSRSILSLRFDNGTARTITLGASNLTIVSGGVMVTTSGGTHVIGANTTDLGILTAGTASDSIADELFFHFVNGSGAITVNARIADNGTDPLSVIKSQGNTLTLNNNNNSFTGGLYVNAGTVTSTNAVNGFGQAGANIYLQGGTLSPRHDNGGVSNGTVVYGQNIIVRANSTINVDRSGTTVSGNTYAFGQLTVDNATVTATNNNATLLSFTGGAAFNGTLPRIDNAMTTTITGAVTGNATQIHKNGAGNLVLGNTSGTPTDNVASTWTGTYVVNAGTLTFNKVAGTDAHAGDIIVNGGTVQWLSDNQLADTSDIVVNGGTLDFNNRSETLASVTLNGGLMQTGPTPTTTALLLVSVVTITGDLNLQTDGSGNINTVAVRNNTSLGSANLVVQGTTRINGLSRLYTHNTGTITLNHLELTAGNVEISTGSGASSLILNGNVTTFASSQASYINGRGDSDSFLTLNGIRTFTVADGETEDDLVIGVIIRNGSPNGGIIKEGAGSLVLGGGNVIGTNRANSFTGTVTVNAGRLDLAKDAGINAIATTGTAALTVGANGTVRWRNSNQIADAAAIVNNGTLDLDYGNADETVAAVSGTNANARILLGPGSTLTTTFTGSATYAGKILGTGESNGTTTTGGVVKSGTGVWELTGASELAGNVVVSGGELSIGAGGSLIGNTTHVKTGTVLSGEGTIANISLESGATLKPGIANDTANTDRGTLTIAGDLTAASGATIRLQVHTATTNDGTLWGGNNVGDAGYISYITTQANTNAAWKSLSTGDMDHLNITGYQGDNGNLTIVSGTSINVSSVSGATFNNGDVFNLLDWTGVATTTGFTAFTTDAIRAGGTIGDLTLPTLGTGQFWDVRLFTTHGILVVVPEPSRGLLIMTALAGMALRRRRKRTA